jgi:hypothetical protein
MSRNRSRFASSVLTVAHLAPCASAIFALVAAHLFRVPGLPTLRPLVSPASSARAARNR